MPPHGERYDVIILGTGITGLSTVYHLRQAGVQSIAIASANERTARISSSTPGLIFGTPMDNITRTSHRHGIGVAKDLWHFSATAFECLMSYCASHSIGHSMGRRLRLITSLPETSEAKLAIKQINDCGIQVAMKSPPLGSTSKVLAAQDEGEFGAVVALPELLANLEAHSSNTPQLPKIKELVSDGRGPVTLIAEDNRHYTCEIVVLACHTDISRLLPELSPAIVTTGDQWCQIEFTRAVPAEFRNLIFTWNHGNVWGGFNTPKSARIGGAKYLRPLEGMEAKVASVIPKINAHLLDQLTANFSFIEAPQITESIAGLDIRPCDELPIVGPMYGNGRMLVACGYMGTGLSWGFLAGKCLADLIASGHAKDLARSLWPERLRSLES